MDIDMRYFPPNLYSYPRHVFNKGEIVNVVTNKWQSGWANKNTDDFIKIIRYRYNKIEDFDKTFFERYKDVLNKICQKVQVAAKKDLIEIIKKQAYVNFNKPNEDYFDRLKYKSSFQFINAFDVIVRVSPKTGALDFYLQYNWKKLQIARSAENGLNLHMGVGTGGRVIDVRMDLPDILNESMELQYGRRRIGHWIETFDSWFRTYGEQLFLRLCRDEGLI